MSTPQSISTSRRSSASPWAVVRANRWAPLPILLAGTFMVVLDFFIVNVALPSMQAGLHTSAGAIQWVLAAYALTSGVFLIAAARLSDRVGRRRVFCIGLGLFTLSSAVCGVAGNPAVLIAARLAQGAAAALIAPNVLSIIGVTFDGTDRARAFGAYGLVAGLAAVSGQLIGGGLIQADVAGLAWRSCFLINVPVGILALALAPSLIGESRGAEGVRVDVAGTALVTATVTALVLPLVEGQQLGWPAWTWVSLAAAPMLLAAFVAQQRHLARTGGVPLVPLALLRERSFSAGLATQLAFWCGQASFFLVLALYLQQGRGLSPLDAGLVFTVLAAAYVLASAQAPNLTERYGRGVLGAGAIVLAAGHGLLLIAILDIGVRGSIALLVPGFVLVGAGMGLMIVPLTTIIMSTTKSEDAGAASGALGAMQNIGGALGVAITGAIFFGALHSGYAHAFELCLAQLAALLLAVGMLTRLLPAHRSG